MVEILFVYNQSMVVSHISWPGSTNNLDHHHSVPSFNGAKATSGFELEGTVFIDLSTSDHERSGFGAKLDRPELGDRVVVCKNNFARNGMVPWTRRPTTCKQAKHEQETD